MAGSVPFGCGQCQPCRINRRRQWQWRQYFEALSHDENCFVTLTYSENKLPPGQSLRPEDLQLFLKRLRFAVSPTKLRFFGVGEYGDNTQRPHYHLSLFGMSGFSVFPGVRYSGAQLIEKCWGHGFIQVAEFNELTASYVAGYVVKKMTAKDDPRLNGRHPEFARMSLRPGIGAEAMKTLAATLNDQNGYGMNLIEETGDVPHSLKIGRKNIPLGRFMLQKLRNAVGFTDEYIKEVKQKISMENNLELLALFKTALDAAEAGEIITPKSAYLTEMEQKIRQLEASATLWKKRSTL